MKKIFRWFIDKFLSEKLDFRVRLFNVLAMAGTLISIIMSAISIFNEMNYFNAIWNLMIAALSFGLLYFSYRTGKYQICYLITTSTIFLGMFSVLFFRSGGYHGGMIVFFVFAVLFTVFMLEGKIMAAMTFLTARQLFDCSGEIDKEEVIHKMKLISSEAHLLCLLKQLR